MTLQQGSVFSSFDDAFRVIDMHTHMFNARYLPLEGIFKSMSVPEKFITPLARICWFLTDFSKFPTLKRTDPKHLKTLQAADCSDEELIEALSVASYIESLAVDCETLIHACFPEGSLSIEEITTDPMGPTEADLQSASTETLALSALASMMDVFEFRSSLDKATFVVGDASAFGVSKPYRFADLFRTFFKQVFSQLEKALDYIDFFWNLTQSERRIFLRLRAYYESLGVDCRMVHHMMDMSHPYSHAYKKKSYGKVKLPYYSKGRSRSQLSQMKALADFSSGQLIGFSAFDPWRFIQAPDIAWAVTEALEKAKTRYKMAGFKFYPPMGYRPDTNDLPNLQVAITTFLKYCVRYDIPVFTHCTPGGFEVTPRAGLNSDPIYWRNLLQNNCWAKDLRLCLGHAGGGRHTAKKGGPLISSGWVSSASEWPLQSNYAKNVAALCRDYKNVYCELANIDSILHDTKDLENLSINLCRELNDRSGSFPFHAKIMYGTDWHMVGMVNDAVEYFLTLSNLFDQQALSHHKRRFFYDNAAGYLKSST